MLGKPATQAKCFQNIQNISQEHFDVKEIHRNEIKLSTIGCMWTKQAKEIEMASEQTAIHQTQFENIPRIGKLPYGAKRGFIERKALLKKGFIEIEIEEEKTLKNCEIWSKF